MSRAMGRPVPFGLSALVVAAILAAGASARADVTTDEAGSILVFPKVIAAGGRDTVIQISNTGNTLVHAHCFYTDARPVNASLPPNPVTNPPIWQETDFFIWLTRQQPTHWSAGRGRALNPNDNIVTGTGGGSYDFDGAGIDPGLVPPVTDGFTGELLCVEVDSDGNPVSGNKLKGEATLITVMTGDAAKYNALSIQAGPNAGATGNSLQLDNDQYNSCPNTLLLNHFAYGVESPVLGPPDNIGACVGGNCPITTQLTLIPCARDYENQIPGRVTVSFDIFNEFEEKVSIDGVPINCWFNSELNRVNGPAGSVFNAGNLGTLTGYTRITPAGNSGGILGVAEETHKDSNNVVARAAFNLHIEGSRFDPSADPPRDVVDVITLTGE